jgi:hypothetical protein
MMSSIRNAMLSALLTIFATVGVASVPVPSAAQSISETAKSAANDVSHWSQNHWNHVKAAFAKQHAKWLDCNKRAADQKLHGHKSWPFLYDCMAS